MLKFEKRILDSFEKNMNTVIVIIITLIGMYVRWKMLPFISSDFNEFRKWLEEIRVGGIRNYTGNYNYAYIFWLFLLSLLPVPGEISIKLFHVMFDFLGAAVAGGIAKRVYGNWNYFVLAYCGVLLSPLVVMNSALWGQCDFLYGSLVLLSLYLILREKNAACFFVYGIAVAFKLQALFIFPFFVLLYLLKKNFSIVHFLMMPIGFLLASLPGVFISGKGIGALFHIYSTQIQQEEVLVQNFPNVYYWVSSSEYQLYLHVGIAMVASLFVMAAFYLMKKKADPTEDQMIALAVWCILCVVYFCPKMHDRYGFVAEVLAIVWVVGHKKWIWYPIVMGTTVLFSYFCVLYGYNLYYFQNMALVNVVAFLVFTIYLFSNIRVKHDETDIGNRG